MSGSTFLMGSSSHFRHSTLYSTRASVLPSIRRWAHSWRQCQKDGQRLETGRGPMIVSSAPHVGIGRGASPNKLQTEEASRGAQQRRGTQMRCGLWPSCGCNYVPTSSGAHTNPSNLAAARPEGL